jgi:hypothetical protein
MHERYISASMHFFLKKKKKIANTNDTKLSGRHHNQVAGSPVVMVEG